jgi:hypothetical protein
MTTTSGLFSTQIDGATGLLDVAREESTRSAIRDTGEGVSMCFCTGSTWGWLWPADEIPPEGR